MKRHQLFLAPFIIAALAGFIYLYNKTGKAADARFKAFYQKEVTGTITYFTYATSGSIFLKLANDSSEYTFYPYGPLPSFSNVAQPGDSFIKHANADTVIVVGKKGTHRFPILPPRD